MSADSDPFDTVSEHPIGSVRRHRTSGQHGLFANRPFVRGDVVITLGASAVVEAPDTYSVQIGENRHIHLAPEYLQYLNHSCDPNVFFDTTAMELVALRDIAVGDEIRFFYPATEWSMAQPFTCRCGYRECLGEIRGASGTDRALLAGYRLTDFIRARLAATDAPA